MKKPDNVNDAQWQAVADPSQYLLIVAGPGTGKTHTLTLRIANFIPQLKTGENILAITFTNKAAYEMRERLCDYRGSEPQAVWVGTFHKFCLSILREHGQDFQIASENDIENAAKEIWPKANAKEIREHLNEISRAKSAVLDKIPQNVAQFNRKLRTKNLFDFDDILQEAFVLLRDHDVARKKIQQRCRYIFVDEYQDTNAIQHEILKLLAGGGAGVTAIGDPNQAIYGFRGSDVKFFRQFEKDFSGAKILSLSENYRSTQNLIEAARQVMAKGEIFKVPPLTAEIYRKGRLVIHQAPTERAEAEYVVYEIEKMVGGTSMFSKDSKRVAGHKDASFSFGDVAVLYRLNSQRKFLEEAFERSGIPFSVSGDKAFWQEQEMKEITVEKVPLMTLHAAKGLEFSIVFIVGCEDGLIPLRRDDKKTDLAEERRLFYVGMTRAKEMLYFVHAKKRVVFGKTQTPLASPFLFDIETQLKEYEAHEFKPRKKDSQLNFKGF